MTDERALANLLGEAPATPNPGFRIDVFGRIAQRARRRAATARAAGQSLLFSLIGLVFAAVQAAGIDWTRLQPIVAAGGVLALASLAALGGIGGPKALLARARAVLHLRGV
jgi:hypothetical protein